MTRKFNMIQTGGFGVVSSKQYRVSTDITDEFNSSKKISAACYADNYRVARKIIEQNTELSSSFVNLFDWFVKIDPIETRLGITSFKSVPYWIFEQYWNKPINIVESKLCVFPHGLYKFLNEFYFRIPDIKTASNHIFNSNKFWMEWKEVNYSYNTDTRKRKSDNVFKFLKKNSPELILFSDNNSIFPDIQVEFAYITEFITNL